MSKRAPEHIAGYTVEFIAPGHSRIKGTVFDVVARACDPRWDVKHRLNPDRAICSGYGKRNAVTRFAQLMAAYAAVNGDDDDD